MYKGKKNPLPSNSTVIPVAIKVQRADKVVNQPIERDIEIHMLLKESRDGFYLFLSKYPILGNITYLHFKKKLSF